MKEFKAYINGEFVGEDFIEIISPYGGAAGKVAALKEKDINKAFEAAKGSFKEWRNLTVEARLGYINKFKNLLNDRKAELAAIMKSEIAKSEKDATVEIERTIEYIDATIKQWETTKYSKMEVGNKTANLHRIPLGVVLAISPFNYPINLSLAKIAPALLVGNTVVFKPATNGSLAGAFITELVHEAGFPKGTFNLVTGRGREIGDVLVENNNIDMISFTGSVGVGKNIAKLKNMIPLVLELGGNDAAYIRHDADIDLAVAETVKGALSYSGQRCTAIKRVILHKDVKEEFVAKLVAKVKEIEMGPLVTLGAGAYVNELIEDSKQRGDEFLLAGKCEDNFIDGHIVLTDTKSRAWREEAFGPLLPIVVIENENDILEIFNDTNFGLQNSIFTKDIEWAKKLSIEIESGSVNINRSSSRGPDVFPFSGVKDSGFGTQGIEDALKSMTRVINIVEND